MVEDAERTLKDMKKVLMFFMLLPLVAAAQDMKPRVIAMTDGEVDDRCSMVRFLLYTNEMDVAAIIETSSCYQREGWSRSGWLAEQIDAYEKVLPNLRIHDVDYPSADYLRSVCFVGDEDPAHVIVDGNSASRLPGGPVLIEPREWEDTPGSDRIVEVLLDDDPRPVYIQAWGGGNTAAKAFQKLKDKYPEDYERAVRKAVVYNIWYQDAAGHYIEREHPDVTMLLQFHFSGTWDYGTLLYSDDFVSKYLHNGKNPLGDLYVQNMISEGDSPAFLYCLGRGLRGHEHPSYGGWGGRFYKVQGFENVWRDTGRGDIRRWMETALHDFQARLDWCITSEYGKANHHPKVTSPDGTDFTVKSGEKLVLRCSVEDDDAPDVERLWELKKQQYEQAGLTKEQFEKEADRRVRPWKVSWEQDFDAGTCRQWVDIMDGSGNEVEITAPQVSEPCTVHILLEVTDTGFPSLTAYQRYIITVLP